MGLPSTRGVEVAGFRAGLSRASLPIAVANHPLIEVAVENSSVPSSVMQTVSRPSGIRGELQKYENGDCGAAANSSNCCASVSQMRARVTSDADGDGSLGTSRVPQATAVMLHSMESTWT